MTMDANTIQKLDARELRHFGLSTGAIVAVLFGALIPWIWDLKYPVWPWVILAVLGLWAVVVPKSLWPVYRLWMRIGLLISKVTTPIILGIVFFLVIMPIGLVSRIFRRDPLDRQFDTDVGTYRIKKDSQPAEASEKPY